MRTLTQKEIETIIENHQHWLRGDCEGWEDMRADFSGANLSNANFSFANLKNANLSYANFEDAILESANLSGANLSNANFSFANLKNANLSYANFSFANFEDAILESANLSGANLSNANFANANLSYAYLSNADFANANLSYVYLSGANLEDANFSFANLDDVDLSDAINIPFIPMTCPEEGSFIGYKKAWTIGKNDLKCVAIIKLKICEDAKRSSATGRKCRCDKAKVISISSLDGSETFDLAYSSYDSSFVYRIDEIVEEPNFYDNRFKECASGIHFFINRQEAVYY